MGVACGNRDCHLQPYQEKEVEMNIKLLCDLLAMVALAVVVVWWLRNVGE